MANGDDDQAGTPADAPIDFGDGGFEPGDDERAGTPATPTDTPVNDGYLGFPGPDDEVIPQGSLVEVIDFGDEDAENVDGDPNAGSLPVGPAPDSTIPPDGPQLENVGPPPDLTEEEQNAWWDAYYERMNELNDELRHEIPEEEPAEEPVPEITGD